MGRRIFVGNLWYGTSEESLRGLFDNGERTIVSVRIITDRETGRSRGFGFVELDDDAAVQAAIEQLDGVELDGRSLAMREAHDRPRRGGGPPSNGRPPPQAPEPVLVEERGRGGDKPRRRQRRRRRDDFDGGDW